MDRNSESAIVPLSDQFKQTAILPPWIFPELWILIIAFSGRARIDLSAVSKWFYVNVHQCAKNQVDAFIKNSLPDEVGDIPSSEYIGLDSLLPFCNLRDDLAVNFIKLANVYLSTFTYDEDDNSKYEYLEWFVERRLGFKGSLITTGLSKSKIVNNKLIPLLLARLILNMTSLNSPERVLVDKFLNKAYRINSPFFNWVELAFLDNGSAWVQCSYLKIFAEDKDREIIANLITSLSNYELFTWIPEFTANYQAAKKKFSARLKGGGIKNLTLEIVNRYHRLLLSNFGGSQGAAYYREITQLLEDFPSLVNMVFLTPITVPINHPQFSGVINNPTPLHLLALNHSANLSLIELFINKGANFNAYASVRVRERHRGLPENEGFAQVTAFYLFFDHPIFNETLLKKMMAAGADPYLRVIDVNTRCLPIMRFYRIITCRQAVFEKHAPDFCLDDNVLRENVLNEILSTSYTRQNLSFQREPRQLRDLVLPPVRGDNATQEKLHIELYLLAKWCDKQLNNFSNNTPLRSRELVMHLSFLVMQSYPDFIVQREIKKLRDDCKENPKEAVTDNMLFLLENYDLQMLMLNDRALPILFIVFAELLMLSLISLANRFLGPEALVAAIATIMMSVGGIIYWDNLPELALEHSDKQKGLHQNQFLQRGNNRVEFFPRPQHQPILQWSAAKPSLYF